MARRPGPPPITRLRVTDLDAVMEIEEHSFSAPWSRKLFEEEFERPWSFLIAIRDGRRRPIAYLNFWVVHDEIHVMNVATHPDHRGKGLAAHLLGDMINKGRQNDCRAVILEVRRSNAAAQHLYGKLGFRQIGVRRRYYSDNDEDALVFELAL